MKIACSQSSVPLCNVLQENEIPIIVFSLDFALREKGGKHLDSKARFNTVSKADLNSLEINSGSEL